ncbi:TPA: hypothetical protein PPN70_002235 [Serratia rubidaea]|uniref:hypothetical protein n=1 Tax=Serratia rubidaea TaxID=61652 RepID=UPI0023B005DA|nr:hypothetical protein [Serratia rubidaea]MDK1703479.1 hypothetical protein [Serratia rubidaea]HDJ1439814.1 hypothetical protein [Serratia rubidaea]HDJ1447296.1 hypothetical protein [Serratia rubidaea]HDJ1460525.1 hypothetical protein [Serratia rubidaea]HDJ2772030.1 hypothetical protein [Serratia rubidaea]
MTFNKGFIRLAGVISIVSVVSGFTRWPDVMFISSCAMIAIWLHAEWDWRRKDKS